VLVWTGAELFVYGGGTSSTAYLAHGARLVPGDSWKDASCALLGCERSGSTAFVDGEIVRVWGNGGGTAPAGLQYDLGTGVWSTWDYPAGSIAKLSSRFVGARVTIYDKLSRKWSEDDAPMPEGFCTSAAVGWSGSELIGWSGECADHSISPVGGRYQPPAP
jgi:hypothetical protein